MHIIICECSPAQAYVFRPRQSTSRPRIPSIISRYRSHSSAVTSIRKASGGVGAAPNGGTLPSITRWKNEGRSVGAASVAREKKSHKNWSCVGSERAVGTGIPT